MPRRRSKGAKVALNELNQPVNVLQANRIQNPEYQNTLKEVSSQFKVTIPQDIGGIRSLFDSGNESPQAGPSTSSSDTLGTAALYDELDSFRQRWKRELEQTKPVDAKDNNKGTIIDEKVVNETKNTAASPRDKNNSKRDEQDELESYAEAKKLFLLAVSLEQDELHHESIRYYKQAMHICPDIERQIFKEQCEASAIVSANADKENNTPDKKLVISVESKTESNENLSLLTRIRRNLDSDNRTRGYAICRPATKPKQGCLHISDLPRELILLIYRYVIGQELDLASLEAASLVCRGFFVLSREQSLWRSVCYSVWNDDDEAISRIGQGEKSKLPIDWRDIFINKPRVNYDGVYISRTKYIRQGDVGFQDLTYRPFHVVRYYRYLRFLPENRVLILTTNEEPEKIVPIFRHATRAKQFSSELSVLEGTYEFSSSNQISIVAEKDCRSLINSNPANQRRQAQFNWSRQTPISQKFNMKFELKTVENKPYRNNVLKWIEYTILTRLEMSQEITSFDLNSDTFPSLFFSRVKRFNAKATKPLTSH